jgi:hypothetical protein
MVQVPPIENTVVADYLGSKDHASKNFVVTAGIFTAVVFWNHSLLLCTAMFCDAAWL